MAIQHISILITGQSGSGKSYLANILFLNLKYPKKIIIDYSGEYSLKSYKILNISSQNYIKILKNFDKILNENKHLIIRFIDFDDDEITKILNSICNWLFQIRNTVILFDEAHNYIPHSSSKKSQKWILKIATMGRKYGISSLFITQRPALLNPTIRANTNVKFVGRLTDPNDLNAIRPYISNYQIIPKLQKRQFIYRNVEGEEYLITTDNYKITHFG